MQKSTGNIIAEYSEEWLEAFKETFKYDKGTGYIYYRIYYKGNQPNTRADSICSKGINREYRAVINFKTVRILSTRAAFLLETGILPRADVLIDHRDRDTLNNKWSNLRKATKAENVCNSKIQSNNTTGVKGLSTTKFGTYRTTINIPGGIRLRETFKSKEEAISYLEDIRVKHHKEFARHV